MTEPTLTLADISAHLDGLLAKARIATDAPAPPWALDLLIGVARYEDEHGPPEAGWGCLADVLVNIPAEVREHAERVAQHRIEGGNQA